MNNIKITHDYIASGWEKAIVDPNTIHDKYVLPKPFVPPCLNGMFRILFYWDTFFTNKGLILDGHTDLALNNVDDLLYMLEQVGYVPNACWEQGTVWCSQPPYLYQMIKDVYAQTQDEDWLKKCYWNLKTEYKFWMTERVSPIGLNTHGHFNLEKKEFIGYYEYVADVRLGLNKNISDDDKERIGKNYVAVAEAGLDWSPRFRQEGKSFAQVDLNANLYGMEVYLSELAQKFEPNKVQTYVDNYTNRKALMDKYMLGKDGLYNDYNFVSGVRSDFYSSGQFMPYVTGLSNDCAVLHLLKKLENKYGITSTEEDKIENLRYQWSYPNTWAPDNYLAYVALKNTGNVLDAKRIARKYVENISDTFAETGRLWEKYDGVSGSASTKTEHEMTEMLGWTGGVFEYFIHELELIK